MDSKKAELEALLAEAAGLCRSRPREALERCRGVMEQCGKDERALRAETLRIAGESYWHLAEYRRGREHSLQALTIFTEIGDAASQARVLHIIGLCSWRLGEFAEALGYFRQCLDLHVRHGNSYGEARVCNDLGLVYSFLADYSNAVEFFHRAMRILREIDKLDELPGILSNIGNVYFSLEEYERAGEYYRRYLAVMEERGDKGGLAAVYNNIGEVCLRQGKTEAALNSFNAALGLCRDLADRQGEATTMGCIGQVYFALGDFEQALVFYTAGLDIRRSLEDRLGEAEALLDIGRIRYTVTGDYLKPDYKRAESELKTALAIAEELHARECLYNAHLELYRLYKSQDKPAKALEHYERFHEIKEGVFNARFDERMRYLQALHQEEQSQSQSEIYRLRNIELVNTQKELEHRNRALLEMNIEKDEFLAIASHDLKNPLATIQGIAEALLSDVDALEREEILRFSMAIHRSAERMFGLISSLIDANRIEKGLVELRPEALNLVQAAHYALARAQAAADAKQVRMQVESPAENLPVLADARAMHNVLDSLLSNAIKFSPPGAQVAVRLRVPLPEKSARRDAAPARPVVQVEVQDEGPGVAPIEQKFLFRKFASLSAVPTGGESSLGLGLAMVKKQMDAMQGRVWCESETGRGARFFLEFPAADTSEAADG